MKWFKLHIVAAFLTLTTWTPQQACAQKQNQTHTDTLQMIVRQLPDNNKKLNVLFEICKKNTNVDTIYSYATQMRDLATKLGDAKMLGTANKFLGWSYNNMGNYEKAMACHYRALIIYDSIADTLNLAWCYNKTGEDLLKLKSYYRADKYLHKSLVHVR